MARGQEKQITGGQFSPHVQQSLAAGKEQAQNRLLTAMREKGATERTQMSEAGATERAGIQAGTQREAMAAQAEQDDKRAAEAERARREDQRFTESMAEVSREFQAKQSELDREQQMAIIRGDRKEKMRIEAKREALRRFNIEMNLDANERNTNAMLSVIKGGLKRESTMEKAKTTLYQEADKFDRDKQVYNTIKDRVSTNVGLDKRMDYPIILPEDVKFTDSSIGQVMGQAARGPVSVVQSYLERKRGRKAIGEGKTADPMAVLQDQIAKHGSNIAVEQMAPESINHIEDQMQRNEIKTEDVNKTLGVIEGMLVALDAKRKTAEGKDADFWGDNYLVVASMRDSLEGLSHSTKKIEGSETETVGSRVRYALGTVYNTSLGGRAARLRDLVGGDFQNVFEEMTKPLQVPKLYEVTEDMNEHDVELRNWFNSYLSSRYPDLGGQL